MATQAFAGGLPAPSLAVTDGILHRLSASERDAIIGHELAHVANRSLWVLVSVVQAQIAIQDGPEDETRQAIETALAAIRANPFVILNYEFTQLKHELSLLTE